MRLEDDGVVVRVAFVSGVAEKLDSVVVGGVATSGFGALAVLAGFGRSAAGLSCEDMMAGSNGAPLTVGCPVGARLAGGVYLLLVEPKGGKSCWRRTPLYLHNCKQEAFQGDVVPYFSSSSTPSSPPTLSIMRSSATCELVATLCSISLAILSAAATFCLYWGSFLLIAVV